MTFDKKFIVENTEIARLLFQRMLIANRFPPVENSMKSEQQLHKTLANLEIKVKQVQRCIWCIRSGQKYTQEKRWVADMEHVEYLHFQNEIGYMNNITLRDVYADRIRPTKKKRPTTLEYTFSILPIPIIYALNCRWLKWIHNVNCIGEASPYKRNERKKDVNILYMFWMLICELSALNQSGSHSFLHRFDRLRAL